MPRTTATGFYGFYKLGDMLNPGPSRTFVFLDERPETLSESVFYLSMEGNPSQPNATSFYDYPGQYHNGVGSLSFADGHTAPEKWKDSRITPPQLAPSGPGYPSPVASPNNPDLLWLQDPSTRRMK